MLSAVHKEAAIAPVVICSTGLDMNTYAGTEFNLSL
jgi:hypothetical protein